MISVEQIRALEERIEKALSFIAGLKSENAELRSRLDRSDADRIGAEKRADEAGLRVLELEEEAVAFRKDQLRIEEGIIHALEKLDAFEDLVLRVEPARTETVAKAPVPSALVPPEPVQAKVAPQPVAVVVEAVLTGAALESGVSQGIAMDATDIEDIAASLPEDPTLTSSPAPSPSRPAVDELDIF
jgi:hypothetical protein